MSDVTWVIHEVAGQWWDATSRAFCEVSYACWLPEGHKGAHLSDKGEAYFLLGEGDA
jgi:hypothetical protein